MKSNTAKIEMKKIVQSLNIPYLGNGAFLLIYTYFHKNKSKVDLANPCSIIDKFTCDAITDAGLWPDDNIEHVREVRYIWGGVDPNKEGYCELKIFEL